MADYKLIESIKQDELEYIVEKTAEFKNIENKMRKFTIQFRKKLTSRKRSERV